MPVRAGSIIARDPVGCRPLYYWTNGLTFVFGSEIKAVLAHPDVAAKPNEDLLADFFLLERLPYEDGGETFFEGIRAVRPGIFTERRAWPHHAPLSSGISIRGYRFVTALVVTTPIVSASS